MHLSGGLPRRTLKAQDPSQASSAAGAPPPQEACKAGQVPPLSLEGLLFWSHGLETTSGRGPAAALPTPIGSQAVAAGCLEILLLLGLRQSAANLPRALQHRLGTGTGTALGLQQHRERRFSTPTSSFSSGPAAPLAGGGGGRRGCSERGPRPGGLLPVREGRWSVCRAVCPSG